MDYNELFEQIESYLAERGYAWVAEQVREELSVGQLKEERISTLAEVKTEQVRLVFDGNFQKGQPAEFVKRAEYTDAESVVLLLEAARRAICDPTLMVAELRKWLASDGIVALSFEAERGDEKSFTVSLDDEVDSVLAGGCALELDELIETIRAS
jgi:hypothetical protein